MKTMRTISVFDGNKFCTMASKALEDSKDDKKKIDEFLETFRGFDEFPSEIVIKFINSIAEYKGTPLGLDERDIEYIVGVCSKDMPVEEFKNTVLPKIKEKMEEAFGDSASIGDCDDLSNEFVIGLDNGKGGSVAGHRGGKIGEPVALQDSYKHSLCVGDIVMVLINNNMDDPESNDGLMYVPVIDLEGDGEGTLLGFGMKKDIDENMKEKNHKFIIKKVTSYTEIEDDYVMRTSGYRVEYHSKKEKGVMC